MRWTDDPLARGTARLDSMSGAARAALVAEHGPWAWDLADAPGSWSATRSALWFEAAGITLCWTWFQVLAIVPAPDAAGVVVVLRGGAFVRLRVTAEAADHLLALGAELTAA
jgi:hypothetical protein